MEGIKSSKNDLFYVKNETEQVRYYEKEKGLTFPEILLYLNCTSLSGNEKLLVTIR